MWKANRKTLIITSLVMILPVLIGVFFWNRLPEVMATHFGLDDQADGFSSKGFAVFGIPLFLLAMQWLVAFVTTHDPRRQNISLKMYTLVLWIIPVISLVVAAVLYPYNLGYDTDISFYMELLMGLMFVVLGNYMPKMRHNYTIGIRVPWTLDKEENWNRTHRFGGHVWVLSGLLIILLTLSGLLKGEWMIGVLLVAALVPIVYSFWLHTAKGL